MRSEESNSSCFIAPHHSLKVARPEEFWIQLQKVFNPKEVLAGQRGESFYCEREDSPLDFMRLDFHKDLPPSIIFFTGHRGSGKSSALIRLLKHFKEDYFVVYFDIEHNLDKEKVNQIDLLYLLGATVFQTAINEGLNPDSTHLRELAEAIYTVTYETKQKAKDEALNVVELVKGLFVFGARLLGAELGEKLAEALLNPCSFTSGVSEEVARKREIEPRVQHIIDDINLIIADVNRLAEKPVLIVVDGLDKLRRPEQAELIFVESRALRGPVCRIIYTVPMLLFNSPTFRAAQEGCKAYFLPNVKLYEKISDHQRYERGYKTLREVVTKRLQSLNLSLEEVFEPEGLDLLIYKSGGLMRWFIELIQDACKIAQLRGLDRVEHHAVQKAIDDFAFQLTGSLPMNMIKELQQVRREKRPSGSPESQELLQGLLIVAYRDGGITWFDAHPLIWEVL